MNRVAHGHASRDAAYDNIGAVANSDALYVAGAHTRGPAHLPGTPLPVSGRNHFATSSLTRHLPALSDVRNIGVDRRGPLGGPRSCGGDQLSASASNCKARPEKARILATRSPSPVSKVIAFENPGPVTAMQVCPALSP